MKFLVVGLGGIGQRHVRNLRTLLGPDAEFVAYRVRRDSPTLDDRLQVEAGIDVETKYGIRAVTDLDAALEEAPDAVLVCNPTSLHMQVSLKAAAAGCGLLIEKPLSHDDSDVDELIELVDQRHSVALVGYQMRFHPCLLRLKELLAATAIGRILAVNVEVGEYLPGWHTYEDYRQMYASRADQGGGVVLSQIHEFDYVYWLFGLPRQVFAVGGHLSRLEIDVEDVASALFECVVDGRIVPVHVHQDYLQRPPARRCTVLGDAGKIVVDLQELTVRVFGDEGLLSETSDFGGFQRNELFLREAEHFLACLRGEEAPQVTVREGAQSLRMALAVKESLASGSVVGLGGRTS
ncbi:Gfo/Idh/MocA family protein [Mycobacterium seoulense]|uniref:Gfo/Idh/MocA family protein n=1 Tax=Mycobacterium seoulense TaxID=386911 RepID=UPI003CF57F29